MSADLIDGLVKLKLNLINFVFASFVLGLYCTRSSTQHVTVRSKVISICHEGMPMAIYSQILTWGQVGCRWL